MRCCGDDRDFRLTALTLCFINPLKTRLRVRLMCVGRKMRKKNFSPKTAYPCLQSEEHLRHLKHPEEEKQLVEDPKCIIDATQSGDENLQSLMNSMSCFPNIDDLVKQSLNAIDQIFSNQAYKPLLLSPML